MIVTVTPNPSVDRTVSVAGLRRGAVHRASASRQDPGGKGVNVSRALALHDVETTAVLPCGGQAGRLLVELLAAAEVPARAVTVRDAVRSNVALVEPDGTTTKINELGPELDQREADALREVVRELAEGARWVVGAGSLPRGLSPDFYAGLVADARAAGARVAIDASGVPMTHAIAAAPTLIKPNRVELAEVVGHDLATLGAVVDASRELIAAGIEEVVVSLGRDGALLITADTVVHGIARVDRAVSTVGAGDALLAGYLSASARGQAPVDRLGTAVAFGSAAVMLPGSQMPSLGHTSAVQVTMTTHPDLRMALDD